jgi:Na+-translocating ferredoxin:NAD+ oxidoreductase RnfA subunit
MKATKMLNDQNRTFCRNVIYNSVKGIYSFYFYMNRYILLNIIIEYIRLVSFLNYLKYDIFYFEFVCKKCSPIHKISLILVFGINKTTEFLRKQK